MIQWEDPRRSGGGAEGGQSSLSYAGGEESWRRAGLPTRRSERRQLRNSVAAAVWVGMRVPGVRGAIYRAVVVTWACVPVMEGRRDHCRGLRAGVARGLKERDDRWARWGSEGERGDARAVSGCGAGLLDARGGWAERERTGERREMGRGGTDWASALGPCGRKKRADWAAGKGWAGRAWGLGVLGWIS